MVRVCNFFFLCCLIQVIMIFFKVYQKPLKRAISESNPIISQEEINKIFSIVEGIEIINSSFSDEIFTHPNSFLIDIIEINESILYELELVLNKWDDKQLIGEIFVSKVCYNLKLLFMEGFKSSSFN